MASSTSLVQRLEKELECSVCLNMYTDPKTLPCLHTFCCHCLNQLAEKRVNREPIKCPDCRTEINLPEGSNFDAFPSSFYLNCLKDIVSVQQEGDQVLCGSCENKSTVVAFCFNCECFICAECRDSHPRYKAMKGHRMTAFNEIKDADVQEILRRPQLCQEKSHTSAVLEYFCKTCQRCICQKCTTIIHKNHDFVSLGEAAEQAKSRLEETEAKVRERADVWREQIKKDQETHRQTKEQIEAARQAIQHNTQTLIQRFIQVAKQHEKEMLTQLDTIQEGQERKLRDQKENSKLPLGQLNSVADYLVSVLKRGIGEEMLRVEQSVSSRAEEIYRASSELHPLKNVVVEYKCDEDIYRRVEHSPLGRVFAGLADPQKTQIQGIGTNPFPKEYRAQFIVVTKDTEDNTCYSAFEGVSVQIVTPAGDNVKREVENRKNGTYTVCFTPHTEGVHHVTVRVRGESPTNSPLHVHVTKMRPRGYKTVATFGSHGSGKGQFQHPVGISVNSTGEVAVSDSNNHRVQLFSADGKHLREFGTQGTADGQFQYPQGLAYNKAGNIIVADQRNSRIQVFTSTGHWIRTFGQEVLKGPYRVSVTSDGNIVVSDATEEKVSMFSPEGVLLLQFVPSTGTRVNPHSAIFHDNKFFVSLSSHMVRVFDSRGSHLYDIGEYGKGVGQFSNPEGLAVNTDDLLLVCDGINRVQVVTLNGEFVTSFGSSGSSKGQFSSPQGITATPDGRVFIADFYNHRIQVFEPQY